MSWMWMPFLAALLVLPARGAETSLQKAAWRVAGGLKSGTVEVHGYEKSLAWEGLLRWGGEAGHEEWVEWTVARAAEVGMTPGGPGNLRREPFNCTLWWLYRTDNDERWLPGIRRQIEIYREEVSRSPEGAIEHPRGERRGGGQAMLIDALQDYSSRMTMLGVLADDRSAFREAVEQHRIYREIVRDPASGLWCQGRGWREDRTELSPGHWSRGHGWLIKGMVDTLLLMPRESPEAREMKGYLKELADALVAKQEPGGMWHCLMNRPPNESPPETSGTALIAGYFGIALAEGILEGRKYEVAARRAFAALPRHVREDGVVESVSPGPGPLAEEEPWMVDEFEPGDGHGPFSILFAALGEVRLDEARE